MEWAYAVLDLITIEVIADVLLLLFVIPLIVCMFSSKVDAAIFTKNRLRIFMSMCGLSSGVIRIIFDQNDWFVAICVIFGAILVFFSKRDPKINEAKGG